jgi:hypothetical protein
MSRLLSLLEKLGRRRVITDRNDEEPYLTRYYILFPRSWEESGWLPFNLYLHQLHKSDDFSALHDHPWDWASLILKGSYAEHTDSSVEVYWAGDFRLRKATDRHALHLLSRTVWTLFLVGRRKREWGFVGANGWKPWREHLADLAAKKDK